MVVQYVEWKMKRLRSPHVGAAAFFCVGVGNRWCGVAAVGQSGEEICNANHMDGNKRNGK